MRSDRYSLRTSLQRIFRRRQQKRQRAVRHFEIMESRVLLAADLQIAFQDAPLLELHGEYSPVETVSPVAEGEGAIVAEGEAAQDLVAFARALAASGTRFYGAAWCPHCTAQKELFEDGGDFLPFIEVTNLDSPVTLNAVGDGSDTTLNPSGVPITSFPTWEFPDGSRLEGEQTLAVLAQRSGVAIPSSDLPFIAPIDDGDPDSSDTDADGDEIVTLLGGSPLHIALDGYDPGGGALTYTVTSSDPGFVSATLLQNNRSMVIDVAGWGKMNFQLFEDRAPRPTSRLIQLAQTGEYNASSTELAAATSAAATTLTVADASAFPNSLPFDVRIGTEELRVTAIAGNVLTVVRGINGTTAAAHAEAATVAKKPVSFHRIINGFVIQGGDITNGDGMGGSNLGDFDDQFHVDLQHNRTGVLSYAKSFDDTNDSQFFITEGATRSLDGNHSISGILVEGEKNREAISNNSTTNPRTVVMNSVDIITDTENAVVMLKATPGATGTATITVTATDAGGNQFSRTFTVNVQPDVTNTLPWLGEVSDIRVTAGQSTPFQFPIIDVEGNPSQFGVIEPTNFTITVPSGSVTSVADITITPKAGFVGQETITFYVADENLDTGGVTLTNALLRSNSTLFDVQELTVEAEASSTQGTITGIVFADTDRDGVLDTGESGLSGFVVFSDSNNNGVLDPGELSARTELDGTYSLTLPAGQHRIRQVEVGDFAVTTDNPVTLNIQSGVTIEDVRFGNFDVAAPTGLDLLAATDSGNNSDNITNFNNSAASRALQFRVNGVVDLAIVRLFADGVLIGQGTGNNGGVTITTNGTTTLTDGSHSIIATQEVEGVQGPASASLTLTIDATPPGAFTSTAPTGAIIDNDISYDADSASEGSGITYSLSNAPAGATINASTGLLSWAPTESQLGPNSFSIVATDVAGNTTSQQLSVRVTRQPIVAASFKITSAPSPDSAEIGDVNVGDTFYLHVSVTDLRDVARGTFAFYEDITFDPLLAAGQNITYSPTFQNQRTGTIVAGEINEVGAVNFDTEGVGPGTFHIYSVRFTATRSGTLNLVGNAPDILPAHDVLVLGRNTAVPSDEIVFGATQLTINPSFGANDDIFNFDEDSSNLTLDVLANDTSLSGSTANLTITALSPQLAGVSIAPGGKSLRYTPAANFNGEITFDYTISDGVDNLSANVVVQIHPINDPPVAVNDTAIITAGTRNNFINVLANDTDIDGDQLRVQSVGQLTGNGTMTIASNGSGLNYTPGTGFTGTDTVTYTVTDNRGGTAQATVALTVTGAGGDVFTVDEGSVNNVFDVLLNDTGTGLTITAVGATSRGGIVTIIESGAKLNYSRPANDNFFGNDTFSYTARAANGQVSTGNVVVTVRNTNDPPTAVNDTLTVGKRSTGNVLNVLANDTNAPDPPGETLTITGVSNVTAGATVSVAGDGKSVIYSPPASFASTGLETGTDTFTYTISDGNGGTAQAIATVNVVDFIPGSLSGFVYVDSDNDGVRDTGEEGFDGVTITLTGTTSFGDTVSRTTTTTSNGSYTFTGLAPGTYRINETQPTGTRNGIPIVDGKDTIGSQGGTVSANDQFSITLAEGVNGTNNNFGEVLGRTLEGSVKFGAERVGGVDLALLQSDNLVTSVSSTAERFVYQGVTPGSYRVLPSTPTFLLSNESSGFLFNVSADADSMGNQVNVRGREAAYISLRDISTMAPTEYAHVALGTNGQEWYSLGRGWEAFTDASFRETNGGARLRIEVTNATGQKLATEIARSDSRLRVLGQKNGLNLVQLTAGSAAFNLQVVTPTNGASGEGSPVVSSAAIAPAITTANASAPAVAAVTSTSIVSPEGESSTSEIGDVRVYQPVIGRPIQVPTPDDSVTTTRSTSDLLIPVIPPQLLVPTTGETVSVTSTLDLRSSDELTPAADITDETRAALLVEVADEYGDPYRYGASGGTKFVPLEEELDAVTEEEAELLPAELLDMLAAAVAIV